MAQSIASADATRHRLLSETRPRMAKVDLRKAEIADERVRVGLMVRRCRAFSGLSLKQFADELQREERQVSRWESGEERVQVDAFERSSVLWSWWLVAQAEAKRAALEITVKLSAGVGA